MYTAATTFELAVPPQLLLGVVWDVAAYPRFVKGVKRVAILEAGERRVLAEFTAGVAGLEFRYTLEVTRTDDEVRWRRVSGSFQDAAGRMAHLGGQRFRYENALDPGFAVPEVAVKFVLERSLPRLIGEFRERALELHGAGKQAPAR